ncbi:two-component system nitrogen regulation sensor histidine kinase NtrY [Sphingomonas leidyi]|uniref:histidine kinase n=1 Tax=Sphingomonas leidyi TaxID=68569 RepID=A0A7X5UYK5_9SPHN|nr:ATP-binding protein [Sphingomonas leidyi]NIJ64674.1 two-component system nitrogen regulation sensor histidine kinase NtrY [Sphingomonas leidyi]
MDALTAEPLIQATSQPRRLASIRMLEMVVVALAIATPVATFLFVRNFAHQVFNPGVAASLLLANLLPYVALIVLIGRRIAIHRATRSALAGGGRLHVRLVAVFTLMASIPIVLTVIAASVMFQSGVQLWGSERARGAFDATTDLAKEGRGLVAQRWATEARTMVDDLTELFPKIPANSSAFQRKLLEQLYYRSFDQAVVFRVVDGKQVEAMYTWEAPPAKIFAARVSGQVLNLLRDEQSYTNFDAEKQWVVTPLDRSRNIFLYVANSVNVGFMNRQNSGADRIVAEFNALQARSRSLQLQFNAVLFGVALLIVSIATWIALAVADRLVQPVEQLVIAARRVAGGDLAARVDIPQTGDEISTLGNAFNGMTERLEHQTGELRTANAQLESRRMLIEAVMSGVSAGVISIDAQRKLRLINESAIELLRPGEQELVGHPLRELAPELDTLLDSGDREAVIQLGTGGDARTLAVKVTSDEAGRVLTFDDITQQLNDQRRAAWSDVARRIAHEIKNPLTPIQLAAERLKRRYGKKIEPEDGTFAQLTDTIVRQVGDLRRMVDEFSSFARMPKPVFRQESLLDIARQAMFLHEVAHPTIRFEMNAPDPAPGLICDRRQIGQAFTNIVKNAVEAIEARGEGEALPRGEIVMTIDPEAGGRIALTLADNGIGLPVERDRIVEPYMTTRSRGTGLGLAIVKKIVEEHFGTIAFSDRPGGGTLVTICFDTDQLAEMASTPEGEGGEEPRPAVLTRSGSAKS